ncbi:MAG: methionyl-tRNA formyltransferase [Verrucomicrobia bacterium]|nr:methionyl-tRNA formyltransferase [Verrucomicrobiota bacterium]
MRIVFIGSAELACDSLEALLNHSTSEVVAAVTQPDRPKGRHLKPGPCPLKELAVQENVPVLSPERINNPDTMVQLLELAPELLVIVAYGQKIGDGILKLPPKGCINLHPSLLPKYRGAAPIQWAIASGERVTGVTTMYVSSKMDAGDIIMQKEVSIDPGDTGGILHDRLAEDGAELVVETVAAIEKGNAPRIPQDDSKASLAPKLGREDGRIDWKLSAAAIANRIRAFNPWPGSFCRIPAEGHKDGLLLKVLTAAVEDGRGKPGEILSVTGAGPLVATADGALRLVEVQPEGKRQMSGQAFLCGHHLAAGNVLV